VGIQNAVSLKRVLYSEEQPLYWLDQAIEGEAFNMLLDEVYLIRCILV
jgi:hypothetical protein